MAASSDDRKLVVVEVAVTAINDSRVRDLEAITSVVAAYLQKSGFEVNPIGYPAAGTSATDLAQDLPGLPIAVKALIWAAKRFHSWQGKMTQREVNSHLPQVTILLHVPAESGAHDFPANNIFAGLLALLPSLSQELVSELPNRRYVFELLAPATAELRTRNAVLQPQDLTAARISKFIRASTDHSLAHDGVLIYHGWKVIVLGSQ